MKKFFSLLAVLALVSMVSSAVWAAGTSYGVKTASATFSSAAVEFSATIHTFVADQDYATYSNTTATADQISFDTSGVDVGAIGKKWCVGTEFIKLHSNLTKVEEGTKIYLYTDNENNTGDYKANAKDTANHVRGLIKKGNTSSYQTGDHAPIDLLCVKVSSATANYLSALPTAFPMSGNNYNTSLGHKPLLDKEDTDFGSEAEWVKVIAKSGPLADQKGGIWFSSGQGEYGWYDAYSGTEDVIMFLGAEFENVVAGDSFATTTIKFNTQVE